MSVPVTNATAILKPRGEDRVRGGHPWVYRSDIADVVDADAGSIVEVRGPRNRLLGHALFSDQSQITIRMISRDETPIDEAFWRARLEAAIRFRDSLGTGRVPRMVVPVRLVRRVNGPDEAAGSGATNICDALSGFKPSNFCAVGTIVLSVRKFTAEVNTSVDGASDEL